MDDAETRGAKGILQPRRGRGHRHEEGAEPRAHQAAASQGILYMNPQFKHRVCDPTVARLPGEPSRAEIVEVAYREPRQLDSRQHALDLALGHAVEEVPHRLE